MQQDNTRHVRSKNQGRRNETLPVKIAELNTWEIYINKSGTRRNASIKCKKVCVKV